LQLELCEACHQYQLETEMEMQKWNNQQTDIFVLMSQWNEVRRWFGMVDELLLLGQRTVI
jgi:wobble nucleotide-excising tRNase